MWRSLVAVCALALAGCGQSAPHDYPGSARSQFASSCPLDQPVCSCTWDKITRDLTYEDYQAALQRYQQRGLMDPRITHARTVCIEANPQP